MKYIINNSVVFDVSTANLSIQGDEARSVTIPAPACRLLNEFIRYEGQPITREHLLKHVWEDYGFAVSSANLNNNVSALRRSFLSLEQKSPIITTIPRFGFQFDAQVQAILSDESESNGLSGNNVTNIAVLGPHLPAYEYAEESEKDNELLAAEMPVPEKPVKDDSKIRVDKNYVVSKNTVLMVVCLTVFILTFAFYIYNKSRHALDPDRIEPVFLYSQEGCDIYTLDAHAKPDDSELMTKIKGKVNSEGLNCNSGKYDIFVQINGGDTQRVIVSLFSKCKREADSSYSQCTNKRILEGQK
jgi:DNA-binding winged helix-turn-helix (wHTH) protein